MISSGLEAARDFRVAELLDQAWLPLLPME
jgi:hypothetical protein